MSLVSVDQWYPPIFMVTAAANTSRVARREIFCCCLVGMRTSAEKSNLRSLVPSDELLHQRISLAENFGQNSYRIYQYPGALHGWRLKSTAKIYHFFTRHQPPNGADAMAWNPTYRYTPVTPQCGSVANRTPQYSGIFVACSLLPVLNADQGWSFLTRLGWLFMCINP